MIRYRQYLPLILLLLPFASPLAAETLDAREIMQRVNDRDTGDRGIADLRMTLIDKTGHERVREIRSFTRDLGDEDRRTMFFLSPPDVKDTAFLTYDYDASGRDDDQWLYLPALGKTKRIASTDKSGSFMGSDFNYSDMTRRDLEKYDFKLLKEQELDGHKMWLIEAVPRTREEMEESGYKKAVVFVRQDNFVLVRAVLWTQEGNRLRYRDVKQLELIDGIWVATETHMTTKKNKRTLHKTILKFNNVRFNQELPEDTWTLRRIEQGL